ncbi:M55 family metallopeptidase [Spirillospora sp. NPDC049024]
MRVYVSADMEGVAGVVNLDQTVRGGHGYALAQGLMTAEVNAAIAGAFDAGATSVTVNDAHGTMDNLVPDELDPRARLLSGLAKPSSMMAGLTPDCDLAIFIGYHAAAGTDGVLAHSFSSHFHRLRLGGRLMSEADVNAIYAASLGVPVGLVSGDAALCRDLSPGMPAASMVSVKEAAGWSAADSLHPTRACDLIREGAASAVEAAGSLIVADIPPELTLEVDMAMPTAADLAAQIPGSERVSPSTVRHTVATPREVLGLISVWSRLAADAARERAGLIQRR